MHIDRVADSRLSFARTSIEIGAGKQSWAGIWHSLHVLCVGKNLVTLRFRHRVVILWDQVTEDITVSRVIMLRPGEWRHHCQLGCHVTRPGDFEDITVSQVIMLWDQVTEDITVSRSSCYKARWLKTSLSARYCMLFKTGLRNEWAKGPHRSSITTKVHSSLSAHPCIFCCSNQIVVVCKEWKLWRSRHFILAISWASLCLQGSSSTCLKMGE
jgi:hypothetical protein